MIFVQATWLFKLGVDRALLTKTDASDKDTHRKLIEYAVGFSKHTKMEGIDDLVNLSKVMLSLYSKLGHRLQNVASLVNQDGVPGLPQSKVALGCRN